MSTILFSMWFPAGIVFKKKDYYLPFSNMVHSWKNMGMKIFNYPRILNKKKNIQQ